MKVRPGEISQPRGSNGSHGVFDFMGDFRPGNLSGIRGTGADMLCGGRNP
jgi:hypothetical protein